MEFSGNRVAVPATYRRRSVLSSDRERSKRLLCVLLTLSCQIRAVGRDAKPLGVPLLQPDNHRLEGLVRGYFANMTFALCVFEQERTAWNYFARVAETA